MSRRALATAAAIAGLVLLAYGGSLRSPLLHDDRTLLASEWVRKGVGVGSAFTTDFWHGTRHEGSSLYRPVTVLSLAWNARLAGSREGFRAVNLVLHLLATAAVFWALAGILRDTRAAAVSAAIFSVHPLGSEAVFWAVGRAEILAALFGLASLRLLLDFERSRQSVHYALSLSAFALALFSKESAASWLLLLPAAWGLLTERRGGVPRGARLFAGYAAVCAVFVALRVSAVGWGVPPPHFVDNPLVRVDASTRVANALLLLANYGGLFLWPANLSLERGFDEIAVRPLLPWAGPAAVALLAGWVAAIVLAVRRGRRALAFLLFFLGGSFAVTSNLLFPIGTIFAERLAYLPLVAASALLGLAAARLATAPRSLLVLALVLALPLAVRTRMRGEDARDLAALHEATAAASPRSIKALYNVGRTRFRTGRVAEAVAPLERAVAIWPDYAAAWALLAEVHAASGRKDESAEAARRAREAAARVR